MNSKRKTNRKKNQISYQKSVVTINLLSILGMESKICDEKLQNKR